MIIRQGELLGGFMATSLAKAQNAVNIVPAVNQGNVIGISQVISPAFAGMGIEPSNIFSFTGQDETNRLSIQLLQNLANFTGVPPHLRIGGNTGDNFIYDPDFDRPYIQSNDNPTGQGNYPSDLYIIGPAYFDALDRFPSNTPITFGLNLAYDEQDWPDMISGMAEAAVTRLKHTRLASFEIGNEPDLYAQNGFRSSSWSGQDYVDEWRDRAQTIYDKVLSPINVSSSFFEAGATAATIGNTFQISDLAQDGILNASSDMGGASFVSAWNQHDYFYYLGVTGFPLTLDYLMDLSQTVAQFSAWATQVQQAQGTGYRYVLREMASAGPAGTQGISDVFGATLWTLNFFLYAASINISSVQMHMTDVSWASAWQPIPIGDTEPHARTTYYAFAAMAQLIGGGCTTRVAPIDVQGVLEGYDSRLGAYAVYQQGRLHSIVLLNTLLANASQSDFGSVTFNISVAPYANQTAFFAFLAAPGADSAEGTTWNGISYEMDAEGKPIVVDDAVHVGQVDGAGMLTVDVRDSMAIVVTFGHPIGSTAAEQYNTTACEALARVQPDASEPPYWPASPSFPGTSPSPPPSPTSSSGGSLSGGGSNADFQNLAPPAEGSAAVTQMFSTLMLLLCLLCHITLWL